VLFINFRSVQCKIIKQKTINLFNTVGRLHDIFSSIHHFGEKVVFRLIEYIFKLEDWSLLDCYTISSGN
jgi:hypothetical protein